jgi:acetolactate synthase-1/2/3 large subunit
MFDQAGMVRELVKWDYELRNGEQLETVVDRALAVAASEPKGPVYLSLPREVLAEPLPGFAYDKPTRRVAAAAPGADQGAIDEAARILAAAHNPLIITASAGRDPAAVGALADLAERFAIAVVQHRPRHLSLAADHSCHLGYDATPYLGDADAVLVLECDVPWVPSLASPPPQCRVVHLGVDPLFQRYPIRGFHCDVAVTGAPAAALPVLAAALERHTAQAAIAARRERVARRREAQRAGWRKTRENAAGMRPVHMAWASACIADAKPADAILVNEYTLMPEHCGSNLPGTYFGSSPASGLGWGGGAALGAKLAAPDRLVIATLGDGSHLFGNPVALHHAAAAHGLPVLFVIMNNSMWGAVRRATRHVSARRGDAQQQAAIDRSRRTAGLRAGLRRRRRLWRAGRRPGGLAGRARPRIARGHGGKAAGVAQRDLPRTVTPDLVRDRKPRARFCARSQSA